MKHNLAPITLFTKSFQLMNFIHTIGEIWQRFPKYLYMHLWMDGHAWAAQLGKCCQLMFQQSSDTSILFVQNKTSTSKVQFVRQFNAECHSQPNINHPKVSMFGKLGILKNSTFKPKQNLFQKRWFFFLPKAKQIIGTMLSQHEKERARANGKFQHICGLLVFILSIGLCMTPKVT